MRRKHKPVGEIKFWVVARAMRHFGRDMSSSFPVISIDPTRPINKTWFRPDRKIVKTSAFNLKNNQQNYE